MLIESEKPKAGFGFLFLKALLALSVFLVSLVIVDQAIKWQLHVPSRILKGIIRYEESLLPHKRLKPNLDVRLTGEFNEFSFRLTTNEEGFRNSFPQPGTPKNYDILFLGDSMTAGVGMEDSGTFSSKTGQILEKIVLNTGCFGYSSVEQLQMVQSIFKQYQPKIVVLAFFAGNDPYENFRHLKQGGAEPVSEKKNSIISISQIKDSLKKNSSLYNLMTRLRRFESVNRLFIKLKLVDTVPPQELVVYRKGESDKKTFFWNATEETLKKIHDEVISHNAQFVIMNIPDRVLIDRAYWNGWLKKYSLNSTDFDLKEPAQRLEVWSKQNNIHFLDLNESFEAEAVKGESPYWRMDLHLNETGNEIVAEKLSGFLKEKSLV